MPQHSQYLATGASEIQKSCYYLCRQFDHWCYLATGASVRHPQHYHSTVTQSLLLFTLLPNPNLTPTYWHRVSISDGRVLLGGGEQGARLAPHLQTSDHNHGRSSAQKYLTVRAKIFNYRRKNISLPISHSRYQSGAAVKMLSSRTWSRHETKEKCW